MRASLGVTAFFFFLTMGFVVFKAFQRPSHSLNLDMGGRKFLFYSDREQHQGE